MSNPLLNPTFQEAVPPQATFHALGTSDFEHYHPRTPGPDEHDLSASPPLSNSQLASDRTSQTLGHQSSSSQRQSLATGGQYSEVVSPAPERAYTPSVEKETYTEPATYSPLYFQSHSTVTTGSNLVPPYQDRKDKPFYKRWPWIIAGLILVVIIVVSVPCAVVFGTRNQSVPAPATSSSGSSSNSTSSTSSTISSIPQPTGDPNYAIGPELSPFYASKDGAFNGTGIAIASATFGADSSIFVFYQDFEGGLQFKRSDPANSEASWAPLYTINENAPRALNGTPLATAAYVNATVATWHLFYVDENYILRQRILTNTSGYVPTWISGPLDDLNLEVNHADSIGMQVCYWGNYYGDATDSYTDGLNGTNPADAPQTGLHL